MQRYGGELIYHARDEHGVLEVVDAHGVRSLHFGTSPKQSALHLRQADRLELPYVRAMLSALLFIGDPGKVLLIGLGGGSLARFLLEQFPGSRVDAIERRSSVVKIAHDYFGLPRSTRLVVHIGEANQLVENLGQHQGNAYDLILIDAFDDVGMDPSINALDFIAACAALLHPKGVLDINLWGSHPVSLKQSIALLKTCFPGKSLRLAVPNRGNVIGFGLGPESPTVKLKQLEPHARELEFRTGLEMPYFLRNLRGINSP